MITNELVSGVFSLRTKNAKEGPVGLLYYRMIQNFGGRKFWRIWRITSDSPKFSCPKFSPLIS